MSRWEQNAVFEYSEYICLVKRINGIVAQKTLVTELVRCKNCVHWSADKFFCKMFSVGTPGDGYCYMAKGESRDTVESL